jgi:hypothetical protein
VEFVAGRGGDSLTGFVAIDDIRFNAESESCDFYPPDAMPTTTTTVSTTIVTEPPHGTALTIVKFLFIVQHFFFQGKIRTVGSIQITL